MIFTPFISKNLELKNRVVMAPMTRSRAIDNIPNELMATYYGQRAGAGLIISEGTSPSPNGLGYPRIPGAFSPAQIEGWKKIADEVHKNDGKIVVQLMHCGRISAKANLPIGATTMAPSPVLAAGEMYTDTQGMQPHDTPKEMTIEDIEKTQQEFVDAAKSLIAQANIDGVELHAANGYLLNQFLNPKSNLREDQYGGNVENRCRFVLELAQKVVAAIGADKVGIRFSPYGEFNDVQAYHDEVEMQFAYLAENMKKLDIAYIHMVDQRNAFGAPDFKTNILATLKNHFKGTIITGGNVQSEHDAEAIIKQGADLVYAGRSFISNPDFVYRIENNIELTAPDPDTFYTSEAKGYTDYAFAEKEVSA